jgi:hypothetical protein
MTDNHNILIGKGFIFLELKRGSHGCTGRDPCQNTFFFHQATRGGNSFIIGDGNDFIE